MRVSLSPNLIVFFYFFFLDLTNSYLRSPTTKNICAPFLLGEADAFDEEWMRGTGRYAPPGARALDYGQDRRAGQQLALTAPPSSTSPPGHRHESPRHRQPHTRPRYDW